MRKENSGNAAYYKDLKFIATIPKSDVHVHLDGSVRLETLIDLARQQNRELPSYSREGLCELVFKERYQDLGEYLEGFKYVLPILQNPESLERVAYELAIDNLNEGVYYLEVRFAPQLHIHPGLDVQTILTSICRGLDRAAKEFNNRPEVKTGVVPEFYYGLIICAMRMFETSFSHYYKEFINLLRYTDFREQTGLASLELARAIVHVRDSCGLPIVGFDLAGQEDGYPAIDHKLAFQYAHQNFLKKTVHAGEAYGPESIFQAITELYADRLGHAYHLFSADLIKDPRIKDKNGYIESLTEYVADRRVTIEVCLTSNLQTLPVINDIRQHSFQKMLSHGLSVTLCTDNRTVSNTTMTNEIYQAINNFDLTPKQLKNILIYGYKRSFFPGTYLEKRHYVRKVIDYYETVEAAFKQAATPPVSRE